jgi:guanidinoacetate N-methyltransferase
MTRRIKRFADFELAMNIKNPDFIRTPQEYQRNWLLNRSINEFASDIIALDPIAARFVKGSEVQGMEDRTQAELDDLEIMEDWQIPIMKSMAKVVTENRGDILEIGFGRGIGSSLIQECGADSHTIIECNHSIVDRFERWKTQYSDKDGGQKIEMKVGLWQDVLPTLDKYDGIFFHTYPLKESDYVEQIADSATFAEHFFEHASAHLRKGGIFTYLSNEIDSLSRHHQRALFKHFDSIQISVAKDLDLPEEVKDQWWADSMLIVKAVK